MFSNKNDENLTVFLDITSSSKLYEKYRDELDDYVTIDN